MKLQPFELFAGERLSFFVREVPDYNNSHIVVATTANDLEVVMEKWYLLEDPEPLVRFHASIVKKDTQQCLDVAGIPAAWPVATADSLDDMVRQHHAQNEKEAIQVLLDAAMGEVVDPTQVRENDGDTLRVLRMTGYIGREIVDEIMKHSKVRSFRMLLA